MATLNITPVNRSFLSNNKFEFVLRRVPNFTYYVQSVNLPSMTLGSTTVNTPFTVVSIPGNQITFGQLTLSFMVDEDMRTWYELYDWIYQLGNPESFNKRGTLKDQDDIMNSVTSDATLYIKTNANNNNRKINFYGAYPTDLGGLDFSSTGSQDFLTASVTFNYTYYKLEDLT